MTEVAENQWVQFLFCNAGTDRDMAEAALWEMPMGWSDRVKLISFAPDAKNPVQENRAAKDGEQDKQRHLVMSLGLATASTAPQRPSLAGTYSSSIGFHSDGAVYLDGN